MVEHNLAKVGVERSNRFTRYMLPILYTHQIRGWLKMINWTVIGQLLSVGLVGLAGPAIIIAIFLRQGNL